jgi:RNA polymerase sigma-70 factor (ECF subfamily)
LERCLEFVDVANFLGENCDIEVVVVSVEDSVLVQRSVEQPAVFSELYERHHDRVLRYVSRRVGVVAAEDLAAETFVRAFRDRARCRSEHGSALPWLMGVASHVVADHRRLEKRRFVALSELVREAPVALEHPESGLTPELADALRRLPVQERDALLLIIWGELSYEEAATALDIRPGTVGSRVFRARKRLEEALDLPRGAVNAAGVRCRADA